ncbi:MAG: tetratricopeptide repeat protein [Myxococcota bacterium]
MSTNQVQKKIHPLAAIAPLAGGLTCAVAAFAGLAWWASGPSSEPLPRPEVVVRAVGDSAEAPSPVTPEVPLAKEVEAPAPAPAPELRVALEGGSAEEDHLELALDALETGEPDKALDALRRHLHHNPATPDVLIRVGRLARELDRTGLATAALAEARRLAPEETTIDIEEARLFLGTGDAEGARAAAARAVARSPGESATWNLLGRAEMAASRWEAAEIAFGQALELDPANPWIHNNRGLLRIYRKEGRDAADDLATAVALFGEDVPHHVHNNLGLALELDGRLEEARAAFEDALAVSPFYVKARVNLRRVDEGIEKRLEAAARRVADGEGLAAVAVPLGDAAAEEGTGREETQGAAAEEELSVLGDEAPSERPSEAPSTQEMASGPEFDELPEGLDLWEE